MCAVPRARSKYSAPQRLEVIDRTEQRNRLEPGISTFKRRRNPKQAIRKPRRRFAHEHPERVQPNFTRLTSPATQRQHVTPFEQTASTSEWINLARCAPKAVGCEELRHESRCALNRCEPGRRQSEGRLKHLCEALGANPLLARRRVAIGQGTRPAA
jgi:hypothetical protein